MRAFLAARTLYDPDGFQVANSLNPFAVSSWMPFKHDPDGSLTLYLQIENPGKDKEANWLPAPKGALNLTMRLYSPKSEALTGRWYSPADHAGTAARGPVGPNSERRRIRAGAVRTATDLRPRILLQIVTGRAAE